MPWRRVALTFWKNPEDSALRLVAKQNVIVKIGAKESNRGMEVRKEGPAQPGLPGFTFNGFQRRVVDDRRRNGTRRFRVGTGQFNCRWRTVTLAVVSVKAEPVQERIRRADRRVETLEMMAAARIGLFFSSIIVLFITAILREPIFNF